jgi:LPS sulfotransferase NodH
MIDRAQLIQMGRARLSPVRAYLTQALGLTRPTRFVIVTAGRSGSALLISLLNSHPDICCDDEILNAHRRWPLMYIEGRAKLARRRGVGTYGLKVQPWHVIDAQRVQGASDWVTTLQRRGWQVIRLSRHNRLHQAISVARAHQEGVWHQRAHETDPVGPITLDPLAVMGAMYYTQMQEELIDTMVKDVDYLSLVYEDDLIDVAAQTRTLERIFEFLGVAPQPTKTDLVRRSEEDMRLLVTNYDEILDEIQRNRFMAFIDT